MLITCNHPQQRLPSPAAATCSYLLYLSTVFLLVLFFLSPVCCLKTHAPLSNLNRVPIDVGSSSASAVTHYQSKGNLPPTPPGILLVSTLDGALHALDAETGKYQWGGKYGTGEALVRSTPVTGIYTETQSQQQDTLFDPFSALDDEYDADRYSSGHSSSGAEAGSDGSSGGDNHDHLIIPGVDGQLFFTTRQGSLSRLPVTVNELVSASPFRSVDDRMYVGKKSSTLFLLDRRSGKVHRVFSATSMEDVRQEGETDCSVNPDDQYLLWIGKQDLSVHALDGKNGKRWNVSLGEYFSFVDGEDKILDEAQLVGLGLPHFAATVDGQLYAIKDFAERDSYLWRHTFHSPISSVHFVRNPDPPSNGAAASLLSSSSMIKLPIFYLPPRDPRHTGDNSLSELSLVNQYLYVRMKQAKTKSIDTYIGKTADGIMYALPNPNSLDAMDSSMIPVEPDFLPLPFLPPAEEDNTHSVIPVASGPTGHSHCPATHPLYPHCMVGVHSIPMDSAYHSYIQLPGLPLPINTSAAPIISRVLHATQLTAPYMSHAADDDEAAHSADGPYSFWTTVLTSVTTTLSILISLYLLRMCVVQNKQNAKPKRKKKVPTITTITTTSTPRLPDLPSQQAIPAATPSANNMPVKIKRAEDESKEPETDSITRGSFVTTRTISREADELSGRSTESEVKTVGTSPSSSPSAESSAAVDPSSTSLSPSRLSVPASSPSRPSDHDDVQESPSPLINSDGSVSTPVPVSASIPSVLSSLSNTYTIGKIQLFTNQKLGNGSKGTVVYAGLHETRECAVKRLVKDCFDHANADKEISLLIQSDQHPNVLRYYAKEEDASFIYIALEKCAGSLQDLIDKPHLHTGANRLQILHNMMIGLSHLHALNIVHRDIKPANVLLTHQYACKLADMGLGKQLGLSRSSFDSVVSRSFGWQPPEVLTTTARTSGSRLTKAVDIFSAGCVIYSVLTTGKHPYGEDVEREINIVKDKINYTHLYTHDPEYHHCVEAKDLISSMVVFNADERLPAADCVAHPLFWTDETKLQFLLDASDRVEAEPEYSECRLTLEYDAARILGENGWDGVLHQGLLDNLGKFRKYDFHSLRDLLRVIRNKRHHYRDLPAEVQQELGPVPTGFLHYFASRFPELLMHVYAVMSCFCLEGGGSEEACRVIYAVCPLDRIEQEARVGIYHPPHSTPLHAWNESFTLTAQFQRYYAQISMKRLLQLQQQVRLKYRPWCNTIEQWCEQQCNRLDADRVVLVPGFGELIMKNVEESEKNNKLYQQQQHQLQQQEKQQMQQQQSNYTGGGSGMNGNANMLCMPREKERVPTAGYATPALSMFPPLLKPSPQHSTPKATNNSQLNTTSTPSGGGQSHAAALLTLPAGFTYVQSKQKPVEKEVRDSWEDDSDEDTATTASPLSNTAATPITPSPTLYSPPSTTGGKSYSAALVQPPPQSANTVSPASITTVSPSSSSNAHDQTLYQHLLRLPKKPIQHLTPRPRQPIPSNAQT